MKPSSMPGFPTVQSRAGHAPAPALARVEPVAVHQCYGLSPLRHWQVARGPQAGYGRPIVCLVWRER